MRRACADGEFPTAPPELGPFDTRPGLVLAITEFGGGSGTNGNAMPGDTLAGTFTAAESDGTPAV